MRSVKVLKFFIKKLYILLINIKVLLLKVGSKALGDSVINRYIESCSERALPYVLKGLGAEFHISSNIKTGLILDNTYGNYKNLTVMNNCYIGKKVFLDLVKPIIIKEEAVISAGVTILTHQDVGNRLLKEYYSRREGEVVLGEGCWLGANCTILSGVTVGRCAVVAAGAVVTKDVPEYSVVAGVPAKVIKSL
jgi:acetyltransferase-like isoleucine patch superfamily enzyme